MAVNHRNPYIWVSNLTITWSLHIRQPLNTILLIYVIFCLRLANNCKRNHTSNYVLISFKILCHHSRTSLRIIEHSQGQHFSSFWRGIYIGKFFVQTIHDMIMSPYMPCLPWVILHKFLFVSCHPRWQRELRVAFLYKFLSMEISLNGAGTMKNN